MLIPKKEVKGLELLQKLVNTFSPSGDENAVRAVIQKEIKRYVDEVYVDKFGNLIAHKKGKGPKVMLAAHMDEVATMIKSIDSNGFIRLSMIGGLDPMTLVGQKVYILEHNSRIVMEGVITFQELHTGRVTYKQPSLEDLYVDTGLSREELNKADVRVGQYVIPHHVFTTLGSKKIISGKALDNRLGCYVLIEAAKRLKKVKSDVYFTFTVQEEVGLYGAKISVYNIGPDWGIAVDATEAQDIKERPALGAGPYIMIKDAALLANKCIDDWLERIAKRKKIPYQLEVTDAGTTDATTMMLSRRGVPSAVISIPVRNLHSTVGVAHMDDINNAILLLYWLLKDPPKKCIV